MSELISFSFFDHRLADALGEAAVNLPFDDHRVDQIPRIVHCDEFEECGLARPGDRRSGLTMGHWRSYNK